MAIDTKPKPFRPKTKDEGGYAISLDWSALAAAPPPLETLVDWPMDDRGEGGIFLPAGQVSLLVGEGGSGKSRLACDLALSVAFNLPWLKTSKDQFTVRQGGVLLVSWEDSEAAVKRRVHQSITTNYRGTVPGGALHLLTRMQWDGPANLIDGRLLEDPKTDLVEAIINSAPDGCRLVILDPLVRFQDPGASENDNLSATELMDTLEHIRAQISDRSDVETTLLAVHHSAKGSRSGADSARGASALRDGARWMADLTRVRQGKEETDLLQFKIVKANEVARGAPIYLVNDAGAMRRARRAELEDVFGEDEDKPPKKSKRRGGFDGV